MIVEGKRPRGCRYSLLREIGLFVMILCAGMLVACGSRSVVGQSLTKNGTSVNDTTPIAAATVGSKTIKPIEVVVNQSKLTSYTNGRMNLTITSSPYAICNFVVSYGMSAPSRASGIKPVTANVYGIASWQWQVEGKAATGRWPLKITATLVNGAQTTQTINVTVILPPINLDRTKSMLSVARKARATLAVVTAPLIGCTMTMSYTSRTKMFRGTTDSKGEISWMWNVEVGARPGIYPLIVIVTTGSGEQEKATFDITLK